MNQELNALARLKAGNQRFIDQQSEFSGEVLQQQRQANLAGQKPFAVVLSCADSRVPVEHIFDQGLGDLFVIRVAGNIATPTQLGSIEYAVEVLGARLVVVLGHSSCGAVAASLEVLQTQQPVGGHIDQIVAAITPAIDAEMTLSEAIAENVKHTCELIAGESEMLARHIQSGTLQIVGADYDMPSGLVTFYP